MVPPRGLFRIFAAGVLAAGFSVVSFTITRAADDDAPPPRRVKTLQERILEVQAGSHDQQLRNNRPQTFSGPELTDREKAVHVLNRLSFGPVPGEVDQVTQEGYQAWIKEQLDPDKIDDSACDKLIAERFPWTKYSSDLVKMDEEFGYQKGDKKKKREDVTSIHVQ